MGNMFRPTKVKTVKVLKGALRLRGLKFKVR